jgi:NADH-quinone oxidoreductase subunit A
MTAYWGTAPAANLRRVTLLNQFAFIGVFLIVSIIFGVAPLALALIARPRKPGPPKAEADERGLQPQSETRVQFKAQHYPFVLAFVLFDVEAAFLLPWALAYSALGLYATIEAITFILILLGGLVYVWREGAFEWNSSRT